MLRVTFMFLYYHETPNFRMAVSFSCDTDAIKNERYGPHYFRATHIYDTNMIKTRLIMISKTPSHGAPINSFWLTKDHYLLVFWTTIIHFGLDVHNSEKCMV